MEVDFFNHTKAFKRINIIFKTLLFLLFIILLIFKSYNSLLYYTMILTEGKIKFRFLVN